MIAVNAVSHCVTGRKRAKNTIILLFRCSIEEPQQIPDIIRILYPRLEKHASDCMDCGHCDNRCPFRVKQSERMKQIAEHFGK